MILGGVRDVLADARRRRRRETRTTVVTRVKPRGDVLLEPLEPDALDLDRECGEALPGAE